MESLLPRCGQSTFGSVPRRTAKPNRDQGISLFDEAARRCANLATLAAFLECYGSHRTPEMLEPKFIAHAGIMIARDVARVREILARLQSALVNDRRKKQVALP